MNSALRQTVVAVLLLGLGIGIGFALGANDLDPMPPAQIPGGEATVVPESSWGATQWTYEDLAGHDLVLLVQYGFNESDRLWLEAGLDASGLTFIWVDDGAELKRTLDGISDQSRVISIRHAGKFQFYVSDDYEDSVPGVTRTVRRTQGGLEVAGVVYY